MSAEYLKRSMERDELLRVAKAVTNQAMNGSDPIYREMFELAAYVYHLELQDAPEMKKIDELMKDFMAKHPAGGQP